MTLMCLIYYNLAIYWAFRGIYPLFYIYITIKMKTHKTIKNLQFKTTKYIYIILDLFLCFLLIIIGLVLVYLCIVMLIILLYPDLFLSLGVPICPICNMLFFSEQLDITLIDTSISNDTNTVNNTNLPNNSINSQELTGNTAVNNLEYSLPSGRFSKYINYSYIKNKVRRRFYWEVVESDRNNYSSYDNFKESWNPDTRIRHEIKKEIQDDLHKIILAKNTVFWVLSRLKPRNAR